MKNGMSAPLGATPVSGGANFSVYAKHATAIELLLFNGVDAGQLARVIRLDPSVNRTYQYWHAFVPKVKAGQIYGYQVARPVVGHGENLQDLRRELQG